MLLDCIKYLVVLFPCLFFMTPFRFFLYVYILGSYYNMFLYVSFFQMVFSIVFPHIPPLPFFPINSLFNSPILINSYLLIALYSSSTFLGRSSPLLSITNYLTSVVTLILRYIFKANTHIREKIQHLYFGVWVTSLGIFFSISIHLPANFRIYFLSR